MCYQWWERMGLKEKKINTESKKNSHLYSSSGMKTVCSMMGIYKKTFIWLTVLEVGSLRLCGSICSYFGKNLRGYVGHDSEEQSDTATRGKGWAHGTSRVHHSLISWVLTFGKTNTNACLGPTLHDFPLVFSFKGLITLMPLPPQPNFQEDGTRQGLLIMERFRSRRK